MTLLDFAVPVVFGVSVYLLCRWLFGLWHWLPLIVAWGISILTKIFILWIFLGLILLPVSIAAAGAYFFATTITSKRHFLEVDYLLWFATLAPVSVLSAVLAFDLVAQNHFLRTNENAGTIYILLFISSPHLVAFVVWSYLYNTGKLPADTVED